LLSQLFRVCGNLSVVCEIFVNFQIHATCKDWWTLGILVFELMSLERRIHKCGNSGRAFEYKGPWYFHCEGNVTAYNIEDTIIVTKHFSTIRSCNNPEAVGVRRHPFAGWIEFQIATNSFENSLKQALWGHLHPVMKWVLGVPTEVWPSSIWECLSHADLCQGYQGNF